MFSPFGFLTLVEYILFLRKELAMGYAGGCLTQYMDDDLGLYAIELDFKGGMAASQIKARGLLAVSRTALSSITPFCCGVLRSMTLVDCVSSSITSWGYLARPHVLLCLGVCSWAVLCHAILPTHFILCSSF